MTSLHNRLLRADSVASSLASTVRNETELTPNEKKLYDKCSDLKSQTRHYRDRCKRLETHLGAAHVLLKEAADTLSEDEIRKMEELTNQNRALKEELQRNQNDTFRSYSRNNSPALGGRVTPTRMDEYHRIIEDRHNDIVQLKQELKKRDELRDAAKISHNILVEKLRVAEAKLKRVKELDVEDAAETDEKFSKLETALNKKDEQIVNLNETISRLEAINKRREGMNEGADGSRWIFEEQETQIENDRLAIARLNTKIERLSAKMEQEAEEHKIIKDENRSLVAKLNRFENQPSRLPAMASIGRMPSGIKPTATPLQPIYDMTSRNFSPTKSSTINDREHMINSSFKENDMTKIQMTEIKTLPRQ